MLKTLNPNRETPKTLKTPVATAAAARVVAGLMLFVSAFPALADETISVNNPGTGGEGYAVNERVITITQDGGYTLTGTTTTNRVVVAQGVTAAIALSNVSITSEETAPIILEPGIGDGSTSVILRLVGSNTLSCRMPNTSTGVAQASALQVEENAGVAIEGSGSLTAIGGYMGAGIGSRYGNVSGPIVINGGTITATGGSMGAGIGSGHMGASESIAIHGGIITATGGQFAAGIGGGGYYGDGGSITITGGSVGAISGSGAGDPAAIGGGCDGQAGTIIISGGNIFACGEPGAGIGGAGGATGGSITISGGNITANKIGIDNAGGATPTTVTDGHILANEINTSTFGNATFAQLIVTRALIHLLIANAPDAVTLARQLPNDTIIDYITRIQHDTLVRHDTLFRILGIDTLTRDILSILHDTLFHHDTLDQYIPRIDTFLQLVRDTLPRTLLVHDTIPIIVRDTIVRDVTVHDTLRIPTPSDPAQYIILIDDGAGLDYPVADQPLTLIPAGEDLYYLEGLAPDKPFAIYDLRGALIARTDRMPVRLPARGVFVVAQGGRYYKFVR